MEWFYANFLCSSTMSLIALSELLILVKLKFVAGTGIGETRGCWNVWLWQNS